MDWSVVNMMILPMLVAMLVVVVIHPLLVKIARRKHIVDNPSARKLNKEPVPILGGVGVVCGILFGIGVTICYGFDVNIPVAVVIALVIMLYTGVGDDILDFEPRRKFVLQVFVVALMMLSAEVYVDNLHGVWGVEYLPRILSFALTLVAAVGVINAINLIDGVDGLCAVYVIFVALSLGLFLLVRGDVGYAVIAFATIGALVPFALHNMYGTKYKMFLGDGGSLVLGFIAAMLALRVVQMGSGDMGINAEAFAFAVLSVPVCDTLRVMAVRVAHGYSPFRPDKRHLHHQFIALGLSHRVTTFAVVALGGVVVVVLWLSAMGGAAASVQLWTVIAAGAVVVWGAYFMMSYMLNHNDRWVIALRGRMLRYGNKHRGAVVEQLQRVLDDKV